MLPPSTPSGVTSCLENKEPLLRARRQCQGCGTTSFTHVLGEGNGDVSDGCGGAQCLLPSGEFSVAEGWRRVGWGQHLHRALGTLQGLPAGHRGGSSGHVVSSAQDQGTVRLAALCWLIRAGASRRRGGTGD